MLPNLCHPVVIQVQCVAEEGQTAPPLCASSSFRSFVYFSFYAFFTEINPQLPRQSLNPYPSGKIFNYHFISLSRRILKSREIRLPFSRWRNLPDRGAKRKIKYFPSRNRHCSLLHIVVLNCQRLVEYNLDKK